MRPRPLPDAYTLLDALGPAEVLTPETRAILPVLRQARRSRLRARILETVEHERAALAEQKEPT